VTPFESRATVPTSPRAAASNESRADPTPAQAAYEARRTARKARSTAAAEPAKPTSGVPAATAAARPEASTQSVQANTPEGAIWISDEAEAFLSGSGVATDGTQAVGNGAADDSEPLIQL
jgi:hypothetical protein